MIIRLLSKINISLPASNQITNLIKNFHICSTCANPSKYLSSASHGIHLAECFCKKINQSIPFNNLRRLKPKNKRRVIFQLSMIHLCQNVPDRNKINIY
jgi:hypothetical protein